MMWGASTLDEWGTEVGWEEEETERMYDRDTEGRVVLNTIIISLQGKVVDEDTIVQMMQAFPQVRDMKTTMGARLFPIFVDKRLFKCFSYLIQTSTPTRGVEKTVAKSGWIPAIQAMALERKDTPIFPFSRNKRVAQAIRAIKSPDEEEILSLFKEWYQEQLKRADDLQWLYIAYADTIEGDMDELVGDIPPQPVLYTMFYNMGYRPSVKHFKYYLKTHKDVLFWEKVRIAIDRVGNATGIEDVVRSHLAWGIQNGQVNDVIVQFLVCKFRLGMLDSIKLEGHQEMTLLGAATKVWSHRYEDEYIEIAKILVQGGCNTKRVLKSLRGSHWFSLEQSLKHYEYGHHVYNEVVPRQRSLRTKVCNPHKTTDR